MDEFRACQKNDSCIRPQAACLGVYWLYLKRMAGVQRMVASAPEGCELKLGILEECVRDKNKYNAVELQQQRLILAQPCLLSLCCSIVCGVCHAGWSRSAGSWQSKPDAHVRFRDPIVARDNL